MLSDRDVGKRGILYVNWMPHCLAIWVAIRWRHMKQQEQIILKLWPQHCLHVKSSKWDKHMVQNNFRMCYMGNMAKLFMKECVWSLCCISCLFLSVSFVWSNFHPNQVSISHFLLILLLPQPIIIPPLCFSMSPTLFLTLDLYRSVISLLSCAVSLCLIWFSFSKSCLKKSRFSVVVPNKLVACTFIPQKT